MTMATEIITTPEVRPLAPSRRALFGAGASILTGVALITGGSIPITAAGDADLIGACAEARRCEAWRQQVNASDIEHTDQQLDELNTAWHGAFGRVLALPATTMQGLKAKAEVMRLAVREFVVHGPDYTMEDWADLHDLLADSVASDVLALAGAA
jgi:hypothetical protein